MSNVACSREEVLATLNDGGELWYFYLEGGVTIHDKDGKPLRDRHCLIEIFLELQRQGVIVPTRKQNHGYPYYANNAKSQVYAIAK
jgi:hypothetical protein